VAPAFLRFYRQRGGDLRPIASRFGLSPRQLESAEVALSVPVLRELGDALSFALGDPWFGLHAALWLPTGAYGTFEHLIERARDLREVAQNLVRFQRLASDVCAISIEEAEKTGTLVHAVRAPEGAGRHANEFSLALIVRFARALTGQPFEPRSVWFAHAAPSSTSELVEFFGCSELRFGGPTSGMEFDRAALDWPVRAAATATAADAVPEELAEAPFLDRVRDRVRADLGQGGSILERVALGLGTSPRTLQRRLAGEGVTFHGVVAGVREQLARVYVEDPAIPLTQVARLLGYTRLGAFARAFRRWMGMPPGCYRREAQGQPDAAAAPGVPTDADGPGGSAR
jgi:AraC-like DNA-binding protein